MSNRRAGGHSSRTLASCVAAAACVVAAFAGGCGSDRLATVPVRGEVVVDGKPVAGVQVVLHPIGSEDPRLEKLRPTGRTAADGTYQIGTYEMADGAPLAEYRITAEWYGGGPGTTTSQSEDPESATPATEVDRFGGRFANPDSSTFKANVGRLSAEVPRLELSTRAAKPPG